MEKRRKEGEARTGCSGLKAGRERKKLKRKRKRKKRYSMSGHCSLQCSGHKRTRHGEERKTRNEKEIETEREEVGVGGSVRVDGGTGTSMEHQRRNNVMCLG